MNAEKKGFKYRLSNVLAWLGFGVVVYTIPVSILSFEIEKLLGVVAFQCFIGVINYLMMGSFRLLPWRSIE